MYEGQHVTSSEGLSWPHEEANKLKHRGSADLCKHNEAPPAGRLVMGLLIGPVRVDVKGPRRLTVPAWGELQSKLAERVHAQTWRDNRVEA